MVEDLDFIVPNNEFNRVIEMIEDARARTYRTVNSSLIDLYWYIGKYLSQQVATKKWGKSVVKNLAVHIKLYDPSIQGFSSQNLWRMKQFYEMYKNSETLSSLLRELPWSGNLVIMAKAKTDEEREFYLHLAVQERYSVRELERQMESGYYERAMISSQKLPAVLRESHPSLPRIFRDTYVLDFLKLPEIHSENELQQAIVANLRQFLLEVGNGMSFIGQEYRLQVGKSDYFIDLLFFHRDLRCLVAFELKIDDFKPEYLGKMQFYLEALDRQVKKDHENPSVGIILCKTKDEEVVELALSRSMSPALVAEYRTKLMDKGILQGKLRELFALAEAR
jgi:predicted nuclease of restriction endonuclease-like (RecB) superfamily